jgi:hypothetical protein
MNHDHMVIEHACSTAAVASTPCGRRADLTLCLLDIQVFEDFEKLQELHCQPSIALRYAVSVGSVTPVGCKVLAISHGHADEMLSAE